MNVNLTDFFAGVCACIAVAGIIILAVAGKAVPAELTGFAGLAAGWLFRGRAQVIVDNRAAQA